jgi:chromosome segregation ATPase
MSEPRLGRRNLPLEIHASKNESMMRSKIRLLEEQVTRLQSGMNLFANLEEKSRELPTNQTKSCGHEQQLRSMSAKLVTLEQDRQRLTRKVNTLESELHDSQEREKSATERISDL